MNGRVITGCLAGWLLLSAAGCGDADRTAGKMKQKLFGPPAPELVAMAFDPDDSDRRREGVVLLSARDWGRQEPYLKGYATLLATDTDPRVRSAAVRALGAAGDETYLRAIAQALDDLDPQVRRDAAAALDEMPGDEAMAPLARHARDDESADVRAACAKALRHYPRAEVVQTLIERLNDDAFCVRYRARESLKELTGRDLGYEADAWADVGAEDLLQADDEPSGAPWWDPLNVTGRGDEPDEQSETESSDEPAEEPPAEPGTQPAGQDRPWWDWFGVTDADEAEPAPADAAEPTDEADGGP
jgi:hypothetical protein